MNKNDIQMGDLTGKPTQAVNSALNATCSQINIVMM